MKRTGTPVDFRRRRYVAALGFALTVSIALLLVACGGRESEETADPATTNERIASVRVATAETRNVPRQARASASIEPFRRVSPGTKLLGRVETVTVSVGDFVKEGTVLARIESRDLLAALEQARAALDRAAAEHENARRQHERITRLYDRGSVTEKMLEDAVSAFKTTKAMLGRAEAQVAGAEVALEYASIETPISGWVIEKSIEAGDMVQPGRRAFTVEETTRVKVIAKVPEREVSGLAPGAVVRVEVEAADWTRDLAVSRVVPSGDPQSRTFDVQIDIENPGFRLKPGMFARVTFFRESVPMLLIPLDSVVRRGQLRGIFVVDEENVARLRWVRTGRRVDGSVEVLAGLEAGEVFVLDPPASLKDGAAVVRSEAS